MEKIDVLFTNPRFRYLIEDIGEDNATLDYSDLFLARIKEIHLCLHNKLFLSALTMALTLPDICGKVEFPNERTNKGRYVMWCDKHLSVCKPCPIPQAQKSMLPYLNGEALYTLRNNILHEGNPDIERTKIHSPQSKPKTFFLLCGSGLASSSWRTYDIETGKTEDSELKIDISHLCEDICFRAIECHIDYGKETEQFSIALSLESIDLYET